MVGKHEPSQVRKAPLCCAEEGKERVYLTSGNTYTLRICRTKRSTKEQLLT